MKLPIASSSQIWQSLGELFLRFRSQIILVVLLQLFASLASVIVPWFIGDILDRIEQGITTSYIVTSFLICLGAVLFTAVMGYFAEFSGRVMGEKMFRHVRAKLMETITTLPLSKVEQAGTGDILGRTTRDVEQVQFTVRMGVSAVIVLSMRILVTIVASLLVSPVLSLMLFVPLPFVYLLVKWYIPKTAPAYIASATAWARVSGTVTETVENAETVDAYNLESRRNRKLVEELGKVWQLERYCALQRSEFFMPMTITMLSPMVLIVLLGAYLYPNGAVTVGQISTVALYAFQLRFPIWEATFWIDKFQVASAAMARIFGVNLVEADRVTSDHDTDDNHLVVDQVSYSYEGEKNALENINLNLEPSQRLAIVGPTGAGKSTLGRMLAGIHPPTKGSVTVGGIPLVELKEEALRRHSVLVTQEHHVFVGTIADNLQLAKADATMQEITESLGAVGALTWVDELDDGIDTRVGSGGLQLDPAQSQQLALARILLINPQTLILDEATSLLDPHSARALEQSLSGILQGRTVVAIAHRLYTAYDADRIAVMIDGRLIELGTHDELLELDGEYASLWRAWQKI